MGTMVPRHAATVPVTVSFHGHGSPVAETQRIRYAAVWPPSETGNSTSARLPVMVRMNRYGPAASGDAVGGPGRFSRGGTRVT